MRSRPPSFFSFLSSTPSFVSSFLRFLHSLITSQLPRLITATPKIQHPPLRTNSPNPPPTPQLLLRPPRNSPPSHRPRRKRYHPRIHPLPPHLPNRFIPPRPRIRDYPRHRDHDADSCNGGSPA